jgi:hypothetical protein
MRLVSKILNYRARSTEETGIWVEKMVCDILKIKFNTKRNYIVDKNNRNYPNKMKKDIEYTLKNVLKKLKIVEHVGNKNEYNDFVTKLGETVSLKTNTNGYKMCSQIIGQCSLKKINEKLGKKFTKEQYKKHIINNTNSIINLYLKYLFCCDHLLSIKFDFGKVYYLNNMNNIYDESEGDKLVEILDKSAILELSKCKLQDWNESNTVKIKIDNEFKSLAEFQVHRSRDSMKCRFNFETILLLINKGIIKNIKLQEFDLKYKYMIKVLKEDKVINKENNKEDKNNQNQVNKVVDESDEEYKESSKRKINIIKKKYGVLRKYALRKYGKV